MQKRRGKKLALLFGAIFLISICFFIGLLSEKVFSYDTSVAHPNIARLAAELYNQNFDPDLTQREIDLIARGAEEEDMPFRWYNHFFDPLNDRGIWFGKQYASAKVWSKTSKLQNDYALGDQSWNRALYEYSRNKKDNALIALGHVVHLLSDMAVPAHTRDDIHPSGDSYEQFVKKNWDSIYPLFKDKIKYLETRNIDSVFDVLATFSNGYFYSDDTIISKAYKNPSVDDIRIVFEKNKDGVNYKYLFGANNIRLCWVNNYSFFNRDEINLNNCVINNSTVLSAYSTHLIPKAVGYSAGLIRLFFNEVEKGNSGQDVAYLQTTPSGFASTLLGAIGSELQSAWSNIKGDVSASPARSESVAELSQPGNNAVNLTVNQPVKIINSTESTKQMVVDMSPVPTEIITEDKTSSILNKEISTPALVDELVLVSTPINSVSPYYFAPIYYYGGGGSGSVVFDNNSVVSTTDTDVEITTSTLEENFDDFNISTTTNLSSTTTPGENTTTTTEDFVTSTEDVVNTTTTEDIDLATTTEDITTSTIATPSAFKVYSQEVVINEIAWAGTSADYPTHEWIELYNNTDEDIVLFGGSASTSWRIKLGDRFIDPQKIINPIIPAHGYYMLESMRDEVVREVPADYLFVLSYGINNNGTLVQLIKPDGSISDEVDCSFGWFAGDIVKYRTMERVDPISSGSDPLNWQSNKGPRLLPRSYNGGQIYGSPKVSNSAGTIALNFYSDENEVVLTKENSPYVLGFYEIRKGQRLIIEPGVILKSYYNDSRIDIWGTLEVRGTEAEPVIFTSGRDLSVSPNFYSQLPIGDPLAKDWQGLWFREGAIGIIDHLDMRYAGKKFYPNGYIYTVAISEAIRAEGANLDIRDSRFLHNGEKFIHALSNSNLLVENSVFADGGLAIQVDGGSAILNNNEFISFSTDPPTQVLILQ